jgi:hypothetical protein
MATTSARPKKKISRHEKERRQKLARISRIKQKVRDGKRLSEYDQFLLNNESSYRNQSASYNWDSIPAAIRAISSWLDDGRKKSADYARQALESADRLKKRFEACMAKKPSAKKD